MGGMQPLLILAGSTGALSTMVSVLKQLPEDFLWPIVILLHLDELFIELPYRVFASCSNRSIFLIEERMVPQPNAVYLAAKNQQLLFSESGFFHYRLPLRSERYCPSIDLLFESVAKHSQEKGVALLLSGMGKDGAAGLKLLRDRGWHTLVEEPCSCAIAAMPRAAIDAEAASSVLKAEELASAIVEKAKEGQRL